MRRPNDEALSRYGTLRDGEWELIVRNGEYLPIHLCEGGAFSWEEGPQWTSVATFPTNRDGSGVGTCMGCGKEPPETMQGFLKLLEWER